MTDTTPKKIDRKAFLTTAAAAWATFLSGCTDEGDGGGTGGTSGTAPAMGGAGSGGTAVGGAGSGGTSPGGAGSGGAAGAGQGGTTVSQGGAGQAGLGGGQSGMSGAGQGGMSGSSGSPSAGAGQGGIGGGTGGDPSGGTGGSVEDPMLSCMSSVEMVNGHTHPFTLPVSDVERMQQDAPYILEDGGTGHTHELLLTAYDLVFLNGGDYTVTGVSSTTNDHAHMVPMICHWG